MENSRSTTLLCVSLTVLALFSIGVTGFIGYLAYKRANPVYATIPQNQQTTQVAVTVTPTKLPLTPSSTPTPKQVAAVTTYTMQAGVPVSFQSNENWSIRFPSHSFKIEDYLVSVLYRNDKVEGEFAPFHPLPEIKGTLKGPLEIGSTVCINYKETFFAKLKTKDSIEQLCDAVNIPVEPANEVCMKYTKDGVPIGEVVYPTTVELCDKAREADPGEYVLKANVGFNCQNNLASCTERKDVFSLPITLTN